MNEHKSALLSTKGGRFEFESMTVAQAWNEVKGRFGFHFMIFAGQRFDFFDGVEVDRQPVFEMFETRDVLPFPHPLSNSNTN